MIPAAASVSSIALTSIAIVSISGLVQSFLFLGSWSDVYTTPYGLTLVGKVAGLAILFAFGAYHRSRLLPGLDHSGGAVRLRSSVKREITVMIAVIMLGGFLAYVPVPPHTH
jgi:putative copper export protein